MYQSAYNDIMEAGAASTRSREKEALERLVVFDRRFILER
jgi:flagellar biosynthesis regulator FlaF